MMTPAVQVQQSIGLPAATRTVHLSIAVGIVLAVAANVLGRSATTTKKWRHPKETIKKADVVVTSDDETKKFNGDEDESDETLPAEERVFQSDTAATANSTTAFINSNKARVQEQMVKRILEQYSQESAQQQPQNIKSNEEETILAPIRGSNDSTISTIQPTAVDFSDEDVIREEALPESSAMKSVTTTLEMPTTKTGDAMESQADRFQRAVSSERTELPTNAVDMDDSPIAGNNTRLQLVTASEFQDSVQQKHPGTVTPNDATQRALLSTRLEMEQKQRQSTMTMNNVKESRQRAILAKRIELDALVKAKATAIWKERFQRALLSERLEMAQQQRSAKENVADKYASIENLGERAYCILKDLGMLNN
eukprot:scaffold3910_cov182-Amphora_coffeaeformis.AAC.4